jgi:hypothetical protein
MVLDIYHTFHNPQNLRYSMSQEISTNQPFSLRLQVLACPYYLYEYHKKTI